MYLHLFMHIGKLLDDRLREQLSKRGTNHAQGRVLGALKQNGRLSQVEIAKGLHLSRATVTVMLQTMEQNGLISREPDPTDGRIVHVRLTEEGGKAETALQSTWQALEQQIRGSIPEDLAFEAERFLLAVRNGLGGQDPAVKH